MEIINYNDLNKNIKFKYSNITNKTTIKCLFPNNKHIFIKTPKSELQSNIKSGFLVINYDNNDKNNIFSNFIKKIEKEANLYIKNKLKKKTIKLHSNFIYDIKNTDKNYIDKEHTTKYIFKLSNKSTIFNYNNEIIDNIDIYSNIILLIKLQNIWLDLDSKLFGLNWTIYQIKVYPPININQCLIYDSDDNEDYQVVKKELIVQKCIFCNSECIFNNTINNISIAKGGKGAVKGALKGSKGGKGGKSSNESFKISTCTSNKSISNNTGRGNNIKDNHNPILPPTADELINIRNKLKKWLN